MPFLGKCWPAPLDRRSVLLQNSADTRHWIRHRQYNRNFMWVLLVCYKNLLKKPLFKMLHLALALTTLWVNTKSRLATPSRCAVTETMATMDSSCRNVSSFQMPKKFCKELSDSCTEAVILGTCNEQLERHDENWSDRLKRLDWPKSSVLVFFLQ